MIQIIVRTDRDLIDLVPNFLNNRKKEVAEMIECLKTGNIERVRFINHDIRGVSLPFGFNGLDALSQELSASYDNRDAALGICFRMRDYLSQVKISTAN